MSFKSRKQRFNKAASRRVNWEDTYKDALQFTAQHRETFDTHVKGERKYDRVFDSTAQSSINKFSSNLQSGLVPPFKKWVKLTPGAEVLEDDEENISAQLESITNTMFKFIHNSNFDTQVSESFVDLAIGTGALMINEGNDSQPLNFTAVPLSELYLEEGPFGQIKTVFRKYKISARNIKSTWAGAKIPEKLRVEDKPDAMIEILESTIYNPELDNYEYTVDALQCKEEIFSETMKSSPWVVFRWSTMPGEIYGRGPMLLALADVKTLNKTVEYLLKSAAFKMVPTFIAADDGVINPYNITIEPGSVIPAAPFGPGGPPIQPLQVGGDVNLGQFIIERMQARIEDMMFTNPLGDVNLPVKSATEMSLRQQDLANRIGSSFGRLQFEFISPLVNRVLDILEKRGLLPVKLGNIKIDGKVVSISHQSPLAQAQDEEELVNMLRYRETMVETVGPEALPAFLNMDEFSKSLAEGLNVNKKLIPTDADRKQMAAQVAAAAQQVQTEEV